MAPNIHFNLRVYVQVVIYCTFVSYSGLFNSLRNSQNSQEKWFTNADIRLQQRSFVCSVHEFSLHGLPVFGEEFLPRDTPTESAFGGRLQTFEVVHNNDAEENTDLARFMLAEKTRIGNLVREKLSNGPHKNQFCVKVQLLKPHRGEEDGSTDDERIEIYTNSLVTPVLNDGMSDETYWTMVDKMLTVLATFAS